MKHCLMKPVALPLSSLIGLSEQYQGIVFLNLGNESVPHFILDLVLELKREKVVSSISPCEIFEGSYLIDKGRGDQRDLVLLLKNMETNALERLKHWISSQTPNAAIWLFDYVAECKVDFADI